MGWTAGTMHSPCASDIVAAGSSYVCRVRDRTNLNHVVEERPISAAARQAGVLSDQVLQLGSSQQRSAKPNHPVRIILVQIKSRQPRRKGGRIAGPASDGILRLATNLLDVPAEIIADIYQHRWTIELFFRFFKHILGCRHLLSTEERGHSDSGLLRRHCLPLDSALDGRQADPAHLRDDLLLSAGLG